MKKFQLTLALFKPDISLNETAISSIREMILNNKFLFVKSKFNKLSLDQAKEFYKVHEKRFFYNRLVYSMSSGPIWSHILYHSDDAPHIGLIDCLNKTRTIYENPDSIRGQFGTTDTRNACHGSDSEQSVRQEVSFFFPEFDIDDWLKNYESQFKLNNVMFDEKLVEHYHKRNK